MTSTTAPIVSLCMCFPNPRSTTSGHCPVHPPRVVARPADGGEQR